MSRYFEIHRADWDAIYHAPAGSLRARVNRRFRRAVWGRMALALAEYPAVDGGSVLDVGCGTGELGLRLAARGATRVVGVDSAQAMVEVAAAHTRVRGLEERCRFVHADFMTCDLGGETFDFAAALGVLDYVADAPAFLSRLWGHTRGRMVVSLPHAVPPRAWARRLWHGLHGSHIHYYQAADVSRLAAGLVPAIVRVHAIHGSDRTDVVVWERPASPAAAVATATHALPSRRWSEPELDRLLAAVRG